MGRRSGSHIVSALKGLKDESGHVSGRSVDDCGGRRPGPGVRGGGGDDGDDGGGQHTKHSRGGHQESGDQDYSE
jgi:hypothetical protein